MTRRKPSSSSTDTSVRPCEWDDCTAEGLYPAPSRRDNLQDKRWFCLQHIRAYNKSWNYYTGMDEQEIEADKRRDAVGWRPSWQLGHNPAFHVDDTLNLNDADVLRRHIRRRMMNSRIHTQEHATTTQSARQWAQQSAMPNAVPPPQTATERQAWKTLGLEPPKTATQIRTRYKNLVKRHHPDAHHGATDAESRLKDINTAFEILRPLLKR